MEKLIAGSLIIPLAFFFWLFCFQMALPRFNRLVAILVVSKDLSFIPNLENNEEEERLQLFCL